MRVELALPAVVPSAGRWRATLRLRNEGADDVTLYLAGRVPTVDLVIATTRGEVVAQRLRGASIPSALQVRTLAPGEAMSIDVEWGASQRVRLSPGEYDVHALLLTDREPIGSPTVRVRVQ